MRLWALPRTFVTGPSMARIAHMLPDPSDALDRATDWTDDRRQYVQDRWAHWAEIGGSDKMHDIDIMQPVGE